MKNLAIIPARGGSKRIPRKNIRDFLGKPMIAYSIETALESGLFDEVMVSTDDGEIAEVAKKYGAKVPFMRSKEMADDYATLSENDVDSVRPVVRFSYPIQTAVKMDNGLLEMFNPEHARTRSQDLEPVFHDAGQFYWMKFEEGMNGERKKGFEIPEYLVKDIDTEDDWKMAELKYRNSFG